MKSTRYVLLLMGSVLFAVSGAVADVDRWSSNGPFTVAGIQALAIDPANRNRVYAGSDWGVFLSTDGGLSWTSLPSAPGYVGELVIDPLSSSNVYAITSNGLFKSGDAGNSWSAVGPAGAGYATSLTLDPLTPSTVVAARQAGVFKSTDGGASWSGSLLANSLYDLVFSSASPSVIVGVERIQASWYYPADSLFFRSTDQAATWTGVYTGFWVHSLAVDPTNSARVYAGGEDSIYRSGDYGTTWLRSYVGPHNMWALAIDPRNPRTLYAASTETGVLRSTDGGVSWDGFNTGLTNRDVRSLAIDCTGTRLYAGTQGGGVFAYQIGWGGTVNCSGEGYEYRTTLPPCRLVDTRGPTGSLGGPALQAQGIREFLVGGHCGVPVTAKAIFANLTAVESTVDGSLTAYPADLPAAPLATSVAYTAGKTRAAASTIPLSPTGAMRVRCSQATSTVHLIVDIQGYFE